MRTLPLVLLAVLALAVGGCGSSSSTTTTTTTSTNPVASAPDATAPPPDATQPGTAPVTTPSLPAKTTTTTTPSGSQQTRVAVDFAIKGGKLVPPGVSAPAKVTIDITVISKDGKPHQLLLEVPPKPRTLGVPAAGRLVVELRGLRAGSYGIELDGHVAGGLVIGRKPGP